MEETTSKPAPATTGVKHGISKAKLHQHHDLRPAQTPLETSSQAQSNIQPKSSNAKLQIGSHASQPWLPTALACLHQSQKEKGGFFYKSSPVAHLLSSRTKKFTTISHHTLGESIGNPQFDSHPNPYTNYPSCHHQSANPVPHHPQLHMDQPLPFLLRSIAQTHHPHCSPPPPTMTRPALR